MRKSTIKITKQAEKDLKKAPQHIQEKFTFWVKSVNEIGLLNTRKCSGWHDEPLHNDKNRGKGFRSIRLNRQWRAIYIVNEDTEISLIEITEVMPHAY